MGQLLCKDIGAKDPAQDFTSEKQTASTPRISVTPPLDEATEAMSMEGPPSTTKAAASGGAGKSQEPDSGAHKEKS